MERKVKGRLAEVKVVAYLIENGYEVYLPFSGNSKYDVLAYREGQVKRISIKFTSVKSKYGSWEVEMRQIFRGNGRINIHKFVNKDFDIVAVYIGPEDRVELIDAMNVKTRMLRVKSNNMER